MGTMPILFTARAHASKDCFSNCMFTLVRLVYLICVVSLSLIVACLYSVFIWHVDVFCYVPLRTWLSRQVCVS
ncbi:putative pollen-specific leucine-rich repeat extensin-like protein 3 [Iris pallida]|uniref:Pollen-specific leucine-rich repeat extensin-like protein 3 n=1 Tax=Iris pallida TaxID=29817 RepID=A0AAX6DRY5_IRIPA|nr:putative pollen-specific leucine-rich repeat extensin-like protein 3 [Iris pallida]